MSVYIKGRKPPNSCDDCWVSDCPNDEHIDGYRMMDRPTYCPLLPVPDHGRLIDATAKVQTQLYDDEHEEWTDVEMTVDEYLGYCHNEVPTIIPADHKEERTVKWREWNTFEPLRSADKEEP